MRAIYFITILLLPMISLANDLRLGSVYPGMTLKEVRAALGNEQMSRDFADGINLETYYSNIIVQFDSEKVVGAYTQSEEVCTFEEICPKQSIENAISVYGKNFRYREDGRYEFITDGEFCWYRFHAPEDTIEWLALVCQP